MRTNSDVSFLEVEAKLSGMSSYMVDGTLGFAQSFMPSESPEVTVSQLWSHINALTSIIMQLSGGANTQQHLANRSCTFCQPGGEIEGGPAGAVAPFDQSQVMTIPEVTINTGWGTLPATPNNETKKQRMLIRKS